MKKIKAETAEAIYAAVVITCGLSLMLTLLFSGLGIKIGAGICAYIFGFSGIITGLWSGYNTKA